MDDRAKKKKAAIMAVMAFIEEEERKGRTVDNWTISGRQMIMKNRYIAQTKIFK
ncbi:MAG: hypothetical protein JXR64_10265 [Spirochaetales bacterium]|nr:hypothetical protein [Spirochaetales bacterium]